MLLEIKDGAVSRGGNIVLQHFSFEIRGNEKAAIVGRNGAGKTTLLEVLAGNRDLDTNEKNPASGIFRSRAFTVGMLRQQEAYDPDKTVEDMIRENAGDAQKTDAEEDESVSAEDSVPDAAGDEYFSKERFAREAAFDNFLTRFGFPKEVKNRKLGSFSGGEQVKLALIRLLMLQPEVLLLDEPTNHLDISAVQWLEQYIRGYPGAVLMVSHDRYFLDKTAEVVWEISHGHVTRYPGNYTAYRKLKTENYTRQLAAWERQQKKIAHEEELIARFKNKARKAAFARSRRKIIARMELIQKPDMDDAAIYTGEILPARPGDKWVYECEDLQIGYKKDVPVRELSLRIRRGQKIGVIGPNGAGKSTFLKTVAGVLAPLKGKSRVGEHIDMAYFDQMTAERMTGTVACGMADSDGRQENLQKSHQNAAAEMLPQDLSVLAWFSAQYPALTEKEIRSRLAGYLFRGADAAKPVSKLSGGEKARLALAGLLERRPNFLVLDEPTNYMDIPARETIESLLRAYQGTVLFVSHDRYFIDRVADSLLIFEADTTATAYYPFSYSHYEARRAAEQGGGNSLQARTAGEQKLIDSFRAVPKKENHWGHALLTDEENISWRFRLNEEEREAAEAAFKIENDRLSALRDFPFSGRDFPFSGRDSENENPGYAFSAEALNDYLGRGSDIILQLADQEKKTEEALRDWTETLLRWYDIWLDTQV